MNQNVIIRKISVGNLLANSTFVIVCVFFAFVLHQNRLQMNYAIYAFLVIADALLLIVALYGVIVFSTNEIHAESGEQIVRERFYCRTDGCTVESLLNMLRNWDLSSLFKLKTTQVSGYDVEITYTKGGEYRAYSVFVFCNFRYKCVESAEL
ncbi:MAG: hypothetical protein MJ069_00325 [Salinivirgaceae bacterium]|nr:hypothetical protein [Salinivirgaceae bacterium]